MAVVLHPYFQWDLAFKAAFQFTSKPVITLANLLSKTSAEYHRGLLEQIGSVPIKAAFEYQVMLQSRHYRLQCLTQTLANWTHSYSSK